MKSFLFFVFGLCLFTQLFAQPVKILPEPLSDRTFQYTQVAKTFKGTPLAIEALVPAVQIVVGRKESPELILQASHLSFMLGQWTHDARTQMKKVKQNLDLAPIKFVDQLSEADLKNFNLIVLGKKNEYFEQAKINEKGSFLKVVNNFPLQGKQTMFVSDFAAARYLANKRLFFKSGAYRGFFSFVKTGIFIEQQNLKAALLMLDTPSEIHNCAKPVMLALSQKDKLPKKLLQIAKKRNKLVFQDLRQALEANNAVQAKQIWQQAMQTCYTCHQGQDGVPKFRKFTPNASVHGYHQKIAEKAGVECATCHQGKTEIIGY